MTNNLCKLNFSACIFCTWKKLISHFGGWKIGKYFFFYSQQFVSWENIRSLIWFNGHLRISLNPQYLKLKHNLQFCWHIFSTVGFDSDYLKPQPFCIYTIFLIQFNLASGGENISLANISNCNLLLYHEKRISLNCGTLAVHV